MTQYTDQELDRELGRLIDRRSSDSVKWRLYDNDVLPLWVAGTAHSGRPTMP